MITVNNLTKTYTSDFELNIDSLNIKTNELIALVGANGSGKSTLLKLIDGVIKPGSGEIKIGCDINREVYYQPQSPFILNSSVYNNIALGFGGKDSAYSVKMKKQIILDAAKKCELSHLLKKSASTLSGGEKQRMIFSRMLVRSRKLLLLDEPFSAMDVEITQKMENLLLEYCRSNDSTLILCTHLPSQALRVCGRMIIMHNGSIAEDGKTSDIMKAPNTDWGQKFISQWRVD